MVRDASTPSQEFYLPANFKLAEGTPTTVDEGIVVEDKSENQFVWVPVPDAIWDGTTEITSGVDLATTDNTYTPMATLQTDSTTKYMGMVYTFSGTTATYQSGCTLGTTSCRECPGAESSYAYGRQIKDIQINNGYLFLMSRKDGKINDTFELEAECCQILEKTEDD